MGSFWLNETEARALNGSTLDVCANDVRLKLCIPGEERVSATRRWDGGRPVVSRTARRLTGSTTFVAHAQLTSVCVHSH